MGFGLDTLGAIYEEPDGGLYSFKAPTVCPECGGQRVDGDQRTEPNVEIEMNCDEEGYLLEARCSGCGHVYHRPDDE